MSPEEYLTGKGFKLRPAPGEHQTQCPFCDDKNKYGHLYVNREHGAWQCHRCGEKGSFYGLQVKLGDKPEPIHKTMADKWAIWGRFVSEAQDDLLDQSDVIQYLKRERGLTPETIGKYRLGWAGRDLTSRMLQQYTVTDLRHAGLMSDENRPLFWDRLIIPYFQRDHVVTVRAKQLGGNTLQAKDTNVYLFGSDNLRGHTEVFVCEGELDAMLLDQKGFAACGIPGATIFQDHWTTWFDAARRVFVCLDADDAGRKGAARIQQALGRRARLIDLPVPVGKASTDISEYFLRDLHSKDEFVQMVDKARGRRVYTFGDGLKEREELLAQEGIALGWKDLDSAIAPGLLPGQVVVVLAKTGVGKTAFITQLTHNLSGWTSYDKSTSGPGVPTLVVSLEQTKAEVSNRIERIGRFYNFWSSPEQIDQWHCNMRMCDENRIPSSDLPVLVDEFIDEVGQPPKMVVVDYLGYWARSFKAENRYVQVSDAIMELKRWAKELGVVIVAPHQVSREGKAGQRIDLDTGRDSGVVEETSDFVFGLYRSLDADNPDQEDVIKKAEVRLEILKSRHGNNGRRVTMLWAPYSLALVSWEMEKAVRVEWAMKDAQAVYSDVIAIHQGKQLML